MSAAVRPPPQPAVQLVGLVPAAGASRRMGQDKRRLPYRGATVLETTVAALRQGGLEQIIVVLEPDSPCVGLPGLARCQLVENPTPERGMLSSLRHGLRALPAAAAAVAVQPGDHPFVPPEAVGRLVQHYRQHRPLLLAPRYAGRRGHPLILGRELFGEALACDDAVGLRQLVRRREQQLMLLDLDFPQADEDLDRPRDLRRLRR